VRAGDVVTLRVRTRAGPTDLVGMLVAASPTHLTLRRRDGSVVVVDVDDVEAGRVVPPGPAQRIGADELHAVMVRGWRPIETTDCGGWLLRASGGFTGRANSALVAPEPVGDLPARLSAVRRWYDDRDLPAKLQVVVGGEPPGLGDVLAEQDWRTAWPTSVMTAEIAHVLRSATPSVERVQLDPRPDDAWLAAYRNDEGPLSPAAVQVLTNHSDVVFASVREDGACVAVARVAVDGRWAGLFAVEVAETHRRRGLAQAVTAAALKWAVARGARRAYLQVVAANGGAVALWERLGFRHHHDYIYWNAPSRSVGM
jgi:ribosomal protein S18 acetylase RimI-like enzyme